MNNNKSDHLLIQYILPLLLVLIIELILRAFVYEPLDSDVSLTYDALDHGHGLI